MILDCIEPKNKRGDRMAVFTGIPTVRLSRADWLELRRRGIGGSDAGHIVLSAEQFRYADPARVWREKVFPLTEEEESLPCAIGSALEPLCARLFERETGRKVRRMNRLCVSISHPYMIADIDRRLCGAAEGLECKCVSQMSARRRITDPDSGESRWVDIFENGDAGTVFTYKPEWYVQMQHYMSVTGWQMWHLGVIVLNNRFYHYDVPRDDAFIDALREAEGAFWQLVEDKENVWEA